MACRLVVAAALLTLLAGCGAAEEGLREVRLVAPAGVVEDVARFERASDCRVDLRAYDDDEDADAIARRRDADVVARPAPAGTDPHVWQDLVHVTVAPGLDVTIPKEFGRAFDSTPRPAGRRGIVWRIRANGDNGACARRWLAHATS